MLGRIALWVLGGWALLCLLAYAFQRKLQYLPDPSRPPRPAGAHYEGLREVALRAADGVRLRAWYWPGTRRGTILLLHGNAGNRGDRLSWLDPLHALGWGLFLLDYRGYGGSSGRPSEEGLYRDAEAAALWLAEQAEGPVAYFGESLGCGVAVELARRRPPAALILQAGASSLAEVAKRAYPFLPARWLLKDRYEAGWRLREVRAPLLSIHGDRDALVPVDLGRALFEAAASPDKEWCEIAGGGHNDLPLAGGRDYYARIHAFLERHLRQP